MNRRAADPLVGVWASDGRDIAIGVRGFWFCIPRISEEFRDVIGSLPGSMVGEGRLPASGDAEDEFTLGWGERAGDKEGKYVRRIITQRRGLRRKELPGDKTKEWGEVQKGEMGMGVGVLQGGKKWAIGELSDAMGTQIAGIMGE